MRGYGKAVFIFHILTNFCRHNTDGSSRDDETCIVISGTGGSGKDPEAALITKVPYALSCPRAGSTLAGQQSSVGISIS